MVKRYCYTAKHNYLFARKSHIIYSNTFRLLKSQPQTKFVKIQKFKFQSFL